jgi:SAM-dependent methyltransferase
VTDFSATYDTLAPRYDAWSASIVPDVRQEWAAKIETYVAPGERVVELGCGTGVPVARLLAARFDYAGFDASPGMLAQARAALPGTSFTHADMHTIELATGSLGAIVAFSSISHTPRAQHAALFAKIATWLRPGGVFVGNLTSRPDRDGIEANWLDAGPMAWSGFDAATNIELLAAAGTPAIESAVIEHTEPDGEKIHPFWFIARK